MSAQALTFKFLMIGNAGVGKTSLVRRLCYNEFTDKCEQTIGVDFVVHQVVINETPIQLQIWDTAGQETYRALGRAYYRDAVGVMLVFAYNSHATYAALDEWINDARNLCDPHAKIMVIGNKTDLKDLREISKAEVEQFAKSHKIEYIETSAKENVNVREAFYRTARSVLKEVVANEIKLPGQAKVEVREEKKAKSCC